MLTNVLFTPLCALRLAKCLDTDDLNTLLKKTQTTQYARPLRDLPIVLKLC